MKEEAFKLRLAPYERAIAALEEKQRPPTDGSKAIGFCILAEATHTHMVLRLAYILCRCWVSCQTTIFCPPELIVTHVEHKKLATAAVFCRLYDDQETRIKVLSKSLED